MGFTHYWSFKDDNLPKDKFDKIVKDVEVIEKYFNENDIVSKNADCSFGEPVKLANGLGENNGVSYSVTLQDGNKTDFHSFAFNGVGELSHETFSLNEGLNEWNFCKTARKPYDLAVCLVLLSVKYHVRSARVSSDGDNKDWQHSFELYKTLFPKRNVSFKFKDWVKDDKYKDGSLSIIRG
jgi:hypothetical protein